MPYPLLRTLTFSFSFARRRVLGLMPSVLAISNRSSLRRSPPCN